MQSTLQTTNKFNRKILLIASLACIIGISADTSLLYVNHFRYENGYDFLKEISAARIIYGHYAGLISIPLACLGLFSLSDFIKKCDSWLQYSILIVGIYTLICGLCYHTSILPLWHLINAAKPDAMLIHQDWLSAIFLGSFCVLNLLLMLVFKRNNVKHYFITPLFFYALIILVYLLNLPFYNAIAVSGFNLSLLFFYIYLCKSQKL